MAKSKNSRKGKKEWRRNISTSEHEAFVETSGRDARSGGPLDNVPSDSLFFVDKTKASTKVRKIDKHRSKTLQSDSILKRASLVAPVAWKEPRPKKEYLTAGAKKSTGVPVVAAKRSAGGKAGGMQDLWGDEDLGGLRTDGAEQKQHSKKRRMVPGEQQLLVPAVEFDLPGCSYNPEADDHQDALALAVAEEVVREARKELEPKAPPLQVLKSGALGTLANEMEMYTGLEALLPEETQMQLLEGAEARGEGEGEEEEEDAAPGAPAKPVRVQKLTRADLNRKMRRRSQEAAYEAKIKRKQLMKDAERVKDIAAEVDEEEEVVQKRRMRREVAKKEKRREAPPRLGKHRFEAEPLNVMLTEELTGSLRQVKGCYTLARDRYKSLQKRGILEPRVPVKRKAAKRRRIVEVGTKGWKEREMHAEILQMRAIRQAKGKGEIIAVE